MKRPSGIPDVAWYDVQRAWLARDAEHRTEIERLKGEPAGAKRRADALESLVDTERQVRKEAENTLFFVRRDLAEGKRLLKERVAGETCIPCGRCITCRTLDFLSRSASPQSTPVCTTSAGSCNSPKACGEAGKCIDARMREVVAPAESTPGRAGYPHLSHCNSIHNGACPPPPAPSDDIRERLSAQMLQLRKEVWADALDLRKRLDALDEFVRKLAQDSATQCAVVTLENKVAALEAKGEPGTHAFVVPANPAVGYLLCALPGCGLRSVDAVHATPKGAKP